MHLVKLLSSGCEIGQDKALEGAGRPPGDGFLRLSFLTGAPTSLRSGCQSVWVPVEPSLPLVSILPSVSDLRVGRGRRHPE